MNLKRINRDAIIKKIAENQMFFILVLIVIIMGISSSNFFTRTNIVSILTTESSRGILALGMAVVIISGGIDLSVGALMSMSGLAAAAFVQQLTYGSRLFPEMGHVSVFVAFLVAIGVGLVFGTVQGFFVAYAKVPPMIVTLGGMAIAKGLSLMFTNSAPIAMLREDFKNLAQYKLFGDIPVIILWFVAMVAVTWFVLNKTTFGKYVYAVGGNINAARVAGVRVKVVQMGVYSYSGVMTAIAGVLLTARTGSGLPTMGDGFEMNAIAAAIIGGASNAGGVGKVSGIVVGVLILGVINNSLMILGVSTYMQQVVRGAVIILAVVLDVFRNAIEER